MQSTKEAVEQTKHITKVTNIAPVQTDPNQKMKMVERLGAPPLAEPFLYPGIAAMRARSSADSR
jgi:hypothetical protein